MERRSRFVGTVAILSVLLVAVLCTSMLYHRSQIKHNEAKRSIVDSKSVEGRHVRNRRYLGSMARTLSTIPRTDPRCAITCANYAVSLRLAHSRRRGFGRRSFVIPYVLCTNLCTGVVPSPAVPVTTVPPTTSAAPTTTEEVTTTEALTTEVLTTVTTQEVTTTEALTTQALTTQALTTATTEEATTTEATTTEATTTEATTTEATTTEAPTTATIPEDIGGGN